LKEEKVIEIQAPIGKNNHIKIKKEIPIIISKMNISDAPNL